MSTLVTANMDMKDDILKLYEDAISSVNEGPVKLGWNIEVYPNDEFVSNAINMHQMMVYKENDAIIGAAVVNYNVIKEYEQVDWTVSGCEEKISTIHALAIAPSYWGKGISSMFLKELVEYCRLNGDKSIHLDVIDTNTFAEGLYLKCGFRKVTELEMYYEVVGARMFSMMEYDF